MCEHHFHKWILSRSVNLDYVFLKWVSLFLFSCFYLSFRPHFILFATARLLNLENLSWRRFHLRTFSSRWSCRREMRLPHFQSTLRSGIVRMISGLFHSESERSSYRLFSLANSRTDDTVKISEQFLTISSRQCWQSDGRRQIQVLNTNSITEREMRSFRKKQGWQVITQCIWQPGEFYWW